MRVQPQTQNWGLKQNLNPGTVVRNIASDFAGHGLPLSSFQLDYALSAFRSDSRGNFYGVFGAHAGMVLGSMWEWAGVFVVAVYVLYLINADLWNLMASVNVRLAKREGGRQREVRGEGACPRAFLRKGWGGGGRHGGEGRRSAADLLPPSRLGWNQWTSRWRYCKTLNIWHEMTHNTD